MVNSLNTKINKLTYDEFTKELNENKITEMKITPKTRTNTYEITGKMKDYKENPDNYKGSVADVSTVIRVALTSSSMTPDLYEIMKLFGKDRVKARINKLIGD